MRAAFTRRTALAGAVPALAALTVPAAAATPSLAAAENADPFLVALERVRAARVAYDEGFLSIDTAEDALQLAKEADPKSAEAARAFEAVFAAQDATEESDRIFFDAENEALTTAPTTAAGALALLKFAADYMRGRAFGDDDSIPAAISNAAAIFEMEAAHG
jgi:hypothetical protein